MDGEAATEVMTEQGATATGDTMEDDTPETLHRRIQEEEHELYPRTLARLFNGEIRIGQPV